jgi:hypothetical protein
MLHSRVGSWPCLQTLDYAGKAYNVHIILLQAFSFIALDLENLISIFWMLHSRVGSWPCPQTVDNAGKACQVQTLQHITNWSYKKFKTMSPEAVFFSCVRPFHEWVVSDLDRSMHRFLWFQVAHSSFIEGSHMTKKYGLWAHCLKLFIASICNMLEC